MKKDVLLPTWAPRVKPFLVRRLYESDAQGLLDAELVDQVGWALYSRCDSFLQAHAVERGQARCPVCGRSVPFEAGAKAVLRCAACGWECPRRAYLDTIKNQQLDGGPEVLALFQQYLDAFPRAKEPAEKMVCIDQLLHGFHHFLGSGRTRRPVAINLIDGHLEFVVDFLERLSMGPESTPGVQERAVVWRARIHKGARRKR